MAVDIAPAFALEVKSATTTVKYTKDGVEQSQDVPYTVQPAATYEEATRLALDKLTREEAASADAPKLAAAKVVDYFNQVMEANARQAARAGFLSDIEGPDRQITAMAKKLVGLKKNLTLAEAEAQIRALMG
jgi:hypothetical protein